MCAVLYVSVKYIFFFDLNKKLTQHREKKGESIDEKENGGKRVLWEQEQ